MKASHLLLVVAAVGSVPLAARPANAVVFEFFEGNNCTQDRLGGFNTIEHIGDKIDYRYVLSPTVWKFAGITTSNSQPWGDEARSVRITSNWRRQREPRTARLEVYDNPDGKRDDDWVAIIVRDAELIPAEGMCIRTFERPLDRNGVFLERHPQNGLDGKISFIRSICNAGCRTNLTTDPNPPPPPKPKLVIKEQEGKKLSRDTARDLKRGKD